MTAFFITILNISISASWMILAVSLVRLLLKRAPRWITCLLWGFVALRLLLPFSIPSPMSLLPSGETIPQTVLTEETPSIHSGIPVVDDAVNPLLESTAPAPAPDTVPMPTPQPQENALATALNVGVWVWIVGMIGILLTAEISYIALRWRLSDAEIISDRIRRSNRIDSPFLFGILHPQIYLPVTLTDGQREYVLAHEQRHLRRLDHLTKLFAYVLLAVYWFNPLVWLAYILFCRDLETACDEGVIQTFDLRQRQEYAIALLECRTDSQLPTICPVAFGEIGIKTRVKNVITFKRKWFLVSIGAILICIVLAGCFLTEPVDSAVVDDSSTSTTSSTGSTTATTNTTTASSSTDNTTIDSMPTTTNTSGSENWSDSNLQIIQHPISLSEVAFGSTVTFEVKAANGIGQYEYRWQRFSNGTWLDIPLSAIAKGVDSPTLTLRTYSETGPQSLWKWMHNGTVRCIVTDAAGMSATSREARLSLKLTASIIRSPDSEDSLKIVVHGNTGYIRCRWEYRNELMPEGEWRSIPDFLFVPHEFRDRPHSVTSTLYNIFDFMWRDRTDYSYRCTVTDEAGRETITDAFIVYLEDAE